MIFLFDIAVARFKLAAFIFWGIFEIIFGVIKTGWGLIMGVKKIIIGTILLLAVLFSYTSENIYAMAAVQPAITSIADTSQYLIAYNNDIEQIVSDIEALESAGRNMEPLRRNGNLAQCGTLMRNYQSQVEDLLKQTEPLSNDYFALKVAAIDLKMCITCQPSAKQNCDLVKQDLDDYQAMASGEW